MAATSRDTVDTTRPIDLAIAVKVSPRSRPVRISSRSERKALRAALRSTAGDLSYEISNTDKSSFKDELKDHRHLLAGVLARLER